MEVKPGVYVLKSIGLTKKLRIAKKLGFLNKIKLFKLLRRNLIKLVSAWFS